MRFILIFILFSWHLADTTAQIMGDQKCCDVSANASRIRVILINIRALVENVENVPPSEEKFLESEKRRALETGNSGLLKMVINHQFYYTLELRVDHKVALDNAEAAANAASTKEQIQYLIVVLSRLGDLQSSMPAYIDHDRARNRPVLSKEARETMFERLPIAKILTTSLLQCIVSVSQ